MNTVLNSLLFIMVSSRLVHTAISYRVVCNQILSIRTQFESVCTRNVSPRVREQISVVANNKQEESSE